jgi:ABC-2 type transport system ATP-binding protein
MIYDKLTPTEYLGFVAGLWSLDPAEATRRAGELLEILNLADHANERCEGFSKGCGRRWRSPARLFTTRG